MLDGLWSASMPTSTSRNRSAALPLAALLACSLACGGSSPAQTPEQAPEQATPAKSADRSPEAAPPTEPAMEDTPADAALPLLGKAAPPIALEGTAGPYDLEQARAEGPVLAVFYRGDW